MLWGGALNRVGVASVGGFAGAALVTTLASQGSQYLGLYLFQRGIGDANRNVLAGVSINMRAGGARHRGHSGRPRGLPDRGLRARRDPVRHRPAVGHALDLRAQGRHRDVLRDLQSLPQHPSRDRSGARSRSADSTRSSSIRRSIPRLHVDAFRKGELRVARLENGFQIYEKTDKADVNVDYFPTGRQFLPPETRKVLIELARGRERARQQGRGGVLSARPTTARASRA